MNLRIYKVKTMKFGGAGNFNSFELEYGIIIESHRKKLADGTVKTVFADRENKEWAVITDSSDTVLGFARID